MNISTLIRIVVVVVLSACPATALDWRSYAAPGLAIDLPSGTFKVASQTPVRLVLQDVDSGAQLDVFSGENAQGLPVSKFRSIVEHADPARVITYRTGGQRWFVLSGYMAGDTDLTELIYYAKFMFDGNTDRFVAFEISYPRVLKRKFDEIVTRLEKSLTTDP